MLLIPELDEMKMRTTRSLARNKVEPNLLNHKFIPSTALRFYKKILGALYKHDDVHVYSVVGSSSY